MRSPAPRQIIRLLAAASAVRSDRQHIAIFKKCHLVGPAKLVRWLPPIYGNGESAMSILARLCSMPEIEDL